MGPYGDFMYFTGFTDSHARRLRAVFRSADWREVVGRLDVEAARHDLMTPPETENVFKVPVAQLVAINQQKVRGMIAAGERDEERLLATLGAWPARWPEDVPVRLSWVGINLSFRCNMKPPCIYCNQDPVEDRLRIEDWQGLLRSLTPTEGEGAYVSFTGGEPLLLGEALWGPEGLLRAAAEAGAASNVNTNALALTPSAALGLVRSGLMRIHISLDSHRPEVEDWIHQRKGRWQQIVGGLHNLQIAKAILNAQHPQIHLNCVLTRKNAPDFPGFARFVLDMKPVVDGAISGDLDMHIIPVGGEDNRHLRLTAAGYLRFFTETWDEANEAWDEYQLAREVPEEKRGTLEKKVPFMSPFHRVEQRSSLEEWAEHAGRGMPASLALTDRCYVAPTQCFILPNGAQYWCGGHSVSRPEPVGSVLVESIQENIRRSIAQMAALPAVQCRSCAGATLAINQRVEAELRKTIREWLQPPTSTPVQPKT